jgi:hypothetical protein
MLHAFRNSGIARAVLVYPAMRSLTPFPSEMMDAQRQRFVSRHWRAVASNRNHEKSEIRARLVSTLSGV